MQTGKPNWFAVFTRPRQEQVALENLQRQAFECFLPMAENPYQRRSWRRGRAIVEPLFPRYLFMNAVAESQNLAPVRSTRGVVCMVRFGSALAVVPESIIAAIRARVVPGTGLVRIEPVAVKAGDSVRVFDGPLAGIHGIVTEMSGSKRATLLVKLLGRSVVAEVDAMSLQVAGPSVR